MPGTCSMFVQASTLPRRKMVRGGCFDERGMKKGAWSEEEDDKLRAYILRFGHWNWNELPKFAGVKRSGQSCRLRWMNYLRPNVKRGNYTKEEEDLIIKLHKELGSKWSVISSKLPGRTDNDIKNHWHTRLKKIVERSTTSTSHDKEQSNNNINELETSDDAELILEPFSIQMDISSSQQSLEPAASIESFNYGLDTSMRPLGDNACSLEMFTEPCASDFWTQPFLEDSAYYIYNHDEGGVGSSSDDLYYGDCVDLSNRSMDISWLQKSSEPSSIELLNYGLNTSMAGVNAGSLEMFTEPCASDSWAQPYIDEDNAYMLQNHDFASSLDQEGLGSSSSDALCYGDYVNLFNHPM